MDGILGRIQTSRAGAETAHVTDRMPNMEARLRQRTAAHAPSSRFDRLEGELGRSVAKSLQHHCSPSSKAKPTVMWRPPQSHAAGQTFVCMLHGRQDVWEICSYVCEMNADVEALSELDADRPGGETGSGVRRALTCSGVRRAI